MPVCFNCGKEIQPGTAHHHSSRSAPGMCTIEHTHNQCINCKEWVPLHQIHVWSAGQSCAVLHQEPADQLEAKVVPDDIDTMPDQVKFETGAVRGSAVDKTPYHMLSQIALRRYANAMYEGLKYPKYNWLKGLPADNLYDHLIEHLQMFLDGDDTEDHLGHALWNLAALVHFSETRLDLFDKLPPGCKEGMIRFLESKNSMMRSLKSQKESKR